jgi:hypothetical protein
MALLSKLASAAFWDVNETKRRLSSVVDTYDLLKWCSAHIAKYILGCISW